MPQKCIFCCLKLILRWFLGVKNCFFLLECQRFVFFVTKTIRFLTSNLKLPFVSFGFRYFLVVFERISFYFHFDHSYVRIKQNVSFLYRNELKIRPSKRFCFMHVDITNPDVIKDVSQRNSFSACSFNEFTNIRISDFLYLTFNVLHTVQQCCGSGSRRLNKWPNINFFGVNKCYKYCRN
jgi:hypothetical protein